MRGLPELVERKLGSARAGSCCSRPGPGLVSSHLPHLPGPLVQSSESNLGSLEGCVCLCVCWGTGSGKGVDCPQGQGEGQPCPVGAEGGVRVSEQIVRRYELGREIVLRQCVRGQVCVSLGIAKCLGVGL